MRSSTAAAKAALQLKTLLAIIISLVPLAAAARGPEVLEPRGAWNVHYADKKCVAVRDFGADKARVLLILEQYGPGQQFALTLVGSRFSRASENQAPTRIRFAPNEAQQDFEFFRGSLGPKNPALIGRRSVQIAPLPESMLKAAAKGELVEPPLISETQLAEVRSLELRYVARGIHLSTGRLDRLFKALDQCTDNLVRSWGFDPVAMRALSRPPRPKTAPGKWLFPSDYPTVSILRGERAIVFPRLNIDETGNVTACEIQQSTKDGAFAEIVCNAFRKRAKFEPALDAAGKPVAAYWRNTVIFQLP